MCNVAAVAVGFWFFLEQHRRDACHFADDAGQHIYVDQDRDWAFAHVLKKPDDPYGSRLDYFLRYTKSSLGSVRRFRRRTELFDYSSISPVNSNTKRCSGLVPRAQADRWRCALCCSVRVIAGKSNTSRGTTCPLAMKPLVRRIDS